MDQENREFIKNEGFKVINEGAAEGMTIGGNLCSFNLLQGTEYMPSLEDAILFIEDDELAGDYTAVVFDRDLQSLIQQPGFKGVKGIAIGRFQKASNMTMEKLTYIIKTKKELDNIPVVYGFDFGHTTPHLTFPLGGKASLIAKNNDVKLTILEH
jgi:muramoyltetrapeptide carboxypeptidase LdcA involved in peptidoglycan recycling